MGGSYLKLNSFVEKKGLRQAFEGVDDRLVNLRNALTTKTEEVEQLGSQYASPF
jgi:predicted RNase H-like nuclease